MTSEAIGTPEAMDELGRRIGAQLRAGDLVVLTGPLGAGKTTLTRGIGAALNVRGPVTSPTFVLARTHPSLAGGPPLVHVDAYRLADARELDDLDIDFERSVVVVEWGAGMLDGITESWLEVMIDRGHGADVEPDARAEVDDDAELDNAELDAAELDNAELDAAALGGPEQRLVTVRRHGPRWG